MCPCCSKKKYTECCGPFISGLKNPSTPEELMRSRYTAYSQANTDYIARTMKSPAADHFNVKDAKQWAKRVEWIKLEVLKTYVENDRGFVEFIAYFKENQTMHALHELSEFHSISGIWFYVDGKTEIRSSE